jgi:FHS family L-fucose permease-like MFS transporter
VLPPVQAAIIDCGTLGGYPAVNLSFLLPMVCFIVVAAYGFTENHSVPAPDSARK